MTTTVLAENLYKAIRDVKQAKWIKSLPVLTHVHIYTRDGKIHTETTNFEDKLKEAAPARVENEINTCVPYRTIVDWLRIAAKAHDVLELVHNPQLEELTITAKPGGHMVRGRFVMLPENSAVLSTRCTIKCIDAQEFPPL